MTDKAEPERKLEKKEVTFDQIVKVSGYFIEILGCFLSEYYEIIMKYINKNDKIVIILIILFVSLLFNISFSYDKFIESDLKSDIVTSRAFTDIEFNDMKSFISNSFHNNYQFQNERWIALYIVTGIIVLLSVLIIIFFIFFIIKVNEYVSNLKKGIDILENDIIILNDNLKKSSVMLLGDLNSKFCCLGDQLNSIKEEILQRSEKKALKEESSN